MNRVIESATNLRHFKRKTFLKQQFHSRAKALKHGRFYPTKFPTFKNVLLPYWHVATCGMWVADHIKKSHAHCSSMNNFILFVANWQKCNLFFWSLILLYTFKVRRFFRMDAKLKWNFWILIKFNEQKFTFSREILQFS